MTDEKHYPPGSLYDLASQFKNDTTVNLKLTRPFKNLIRRVAKENQFSMNDFIRQAIIYYLEENYHDYLSLYEHLLVEEVERQQK